MLKCSDFPFKIIKKGIFLFGSSGNTTVRWAQKIKGFVVFNYKNFKIMLLSLILVILNNISF